MPARLHVAPDRSQRRGPLEHDLPEEQDERAGHVVAVREERPVARIGLLLRVHPADGEDHVVGLAGQEVSPARATVGQEADAGGEPFLDLRAVRGRRARHHPAGLLLDPAERRDVLVGAQQDPGLTGPGLRREVGLPLDQAVRVRGEPAGQVGRVAVAHRTVQHRQGEAVDLEEHEARDVGRVDDAQPTRDPSRDPDRRRSSAPAALPARCSPPRPRATRASPIRSCRRDPSVRYRSASRMAASANHTSRKPSTSVAGRRSAARTGGITAFSTATTAATSSAPQKPSM